MGLISDKTKVLYTELNERAEAATGSYSGTGNSYSIFILCLCLRIIGTFDHGVQFMNFPSQIFFNDINHYRAAILKKNSLWLLLFYMVWLLISIMKRCAERCALQLYQTSLIQKDGIMVANLHHFYTIKVTCCKTFRKISYK